ncbi:MAG: hypothetical protein ACPGN3_18170, partial [Opitutales bacterium]
LRLAKLGQAKHLWSWDLASWATQDLNANGLPDYIDVNWAAVIAGDPNFVAAVQADFYDPEGLITGDPDDPNDDLAFLPIKPTDTTGLSSLQWDYDGDNISNYQEYLDGTDPTDFFNGETPTLRIYGGDGQCGAPGAFLNMSLIVKVYAADDSEILKAPVIFSTPDQHAGLAVLEQDTPQASLHHYTDMAGTSARYRTPDRIGLSTVLASLPNGHSVTFTVHTVSESDAAKPPIRNFTETANADGSTTYTWTSDADAGSWFQIEQKQTDGSWKPVYQTHYGSATLPYVAGQSAYTLTLDEHQQPLLP